MFNDCEISKPPIQQVSGAPQGCFVPQNSSNMARPGRERGGELRPVVGAQGKPGFLGKAAAGGVVSQAGSVGWLSVRLQVETGVGERSLLS